MFDISTLHLHEVKADVMLFVRTSQETMSIIIHRILFLVVELSMSHFGR